MSRLLAHAPLRVQLLVTFAIAPFVLMAIGLSVIPETVEFALGDDRNDTVRPLVRAITVVLAFVIAASCVAAVGAALSLHASLTRILQRMQAMADAVGAGEFDQRLELGRRDELGQLADSIDQMAARLQQLEYMRRRMLAAVSHELRTPLTIIRGVAWTLSRTEPDSARLEQFSLIDAESERLAALISELLDAARLHAHTAVDLQSHDLTRIITDAADRFREQVRARSLRLAVIGVDAPCPVVCDAARMHQVFANILGNAIRHARVGTIVAIELRDRRDGITVDISNTGEMIPSELTETIFQPFAQHGDRRGSMGLGLSIARDITRAHGGDVSCESHESCTTFRIDLPDAVRDRTIRSADPLVAVVPSFSHHMARGASA